MSKIQNTPTISSQSTSRKPPTENQSYASVTANIKEKETNTKPQKNQEINTNKDESFEDFQAFIQELYQIYIKFRNVKENQSKLKLAMEAIRVFENHNYE